jgi:hypothetical protein
MALKRAPDHLGISLTMLAYDGAAFAAVDKVIHLDPPHYSSSQRLADLWLFHQSTPCRITRQATETFHRYGYQAHIESLSTIQ